ncbi:MULTISPECIES: hypothetical protein [Aequorivita]|uniref:Two-component sensor histidine kinase n=2 Tax=Aequorivita TaxID=153265 RepID=A0AB35YYH6_9FLAO|nr:hypothetical protein [Aequorivita sp. Ant34-E75]WGF92889.1 hypothetical protein QCQ61_01545 [Aequorivita sp. Ant34-E75]
MYLQIAILSVLLLSVIGIVFWFLQMKKTEIQTHNQKMANLENAIFKNYSQLNFRSLNLNKYDFLKYNLDEALIKQPDIAL